MYALVVRFDLTPAGVGGFDQLVAETLPLIVVHEPGTLLYATHTVTGEPTARIFYEIYADQAAFDAHERQDHVVRFLAERQRYLAGPVRVEFVTPGMATGLPVGQR